MKYAKRFIYIIITIAIILSSFPMSAFATDISDIMEEYNELLSSYDNDKSFIDYVTITKENVNYSASPMVSINNLCEYIGADYIPDAKDTTGYSIIEYDDNTIFFNETSGVMDVQRDANDDIVVLDETPYEENDDVFVPLEQFSSVLGYESFEDDDSFILTRPYQTCRLLVSTRKSIDKLDSVASVRDTKNDITILQFEDEASTMEAAKYYEEQKCVLSVEPDEIYSASKLATVTELSGKHIAQAASNAINIDYMNEYLATQALNDITVAVVDSGVCSEHKDLANRVTRADVNFSSSKITNSEDDNGHGTHVSGTIVDNTLCNVNVLAVKALNEEGSGTDYAIYNALQYVATTDAKVVNMSLGKYGKGGIMVDAINNLIEKDVVVCVAAGNSYSNAEYFFPASMESCITVGAITSDGKRPASFTNFGDVVDIAAPGVNIKSTWLNNGYHTTSGTSMATPFVSAVAAMICSKDKSNNAFTTVKLIQDKANHSADSYYANTWNCGYLDCKDIFECNRANIPKANYETGIYYGKITLELTTDEPNGVIYYSTNGYPASKSNGKVYTEPLELENKTNISACTYVDGKLKSQQLVLDLTIFKASSVSDSDFTINSSGVITKCKKDATEYVDVVIPTFIDGEVVRGIGPDVFTNNKYLESIVLPDTANYIGLRAFSGCTNLKYVKAIGLTYVAIEGFYNCSNLEELNSYPIEYLGNSSFYNCSKLTQLDLKNVTTISERALYNCGIEDLNCKKLKYVETNGCCGMKNISIICFDNLIELGTGAFSSCSNLEEAILPNIETTSKNCFYNCSMLSKVDLGNKITSIANRAFYNCEKLNSFNAPSVEEIDVEGLYGCSKLKYLSLPSLITVQNDGLYGCSIINLNAPKLEQVYGTLSFNGDTFYSSSIKYLEILSAQNLKYLYLPSCTQIVTSVSASNLRKVYLPNLTTFGKSSSSSSTLFSGCNELEELDLPMLTTIVNANSKIATVGKGDVKLRHINMPSMPKYYDLSRYFTGMKFEILRDLPENQKGGMLCPSFRGYNLKFKWYYGTSKDGVLSEISGANEECYYPSKTGYYKLVVTKGLSEEAELETGICYYTVDGDITRNLSINSSGEFDLYINDAKQKVKNASNTYSYNNTVTNGDNIRIEYLGNDLEAWISDNRTVSTSKSYTFEIASDITITANVKKASTLSSTVSFYNANGQFISSGKYSKYVKFKASDLPANPCLYGYTFTGWDKSINDINDLLSQGKNVIVTAVYQRNSSLKHIDVTNGSITKINGDYSANISDVEQLDYVTVSAENSEELIFLYWVDEYGNIVSYDKDYTFYVSTDVSFMAVYGLEVPAKKSIIRISGEIYDMSSGKITFVAERNIIDCKTILEQGIILTNNNDLDANTFVLDNQYIKKGVSVDKSTKGTYILTKKNVLSTDNWRARAYVIYKTNDGKIKTLYSDLA